MKLRRFKIWLKFKLLRHHYLLILGVIVAAAVLFVCLSRNFEMSGWQLLLTAIGGAISLIYIIEKQHLDETLLFKDLFMTFNNRYNDLNEGMNNYRLELIGGSTEASFEKLNDYFNLCGEEYLFYINGYIYPEVWESWINGMAHFYKVPRIRELWDSELKLNSYYGFDIRAEMGRLNISIDNS